MRGDRVGLTSLGQDGFRGMWGYEAARFVDILRKFGTGCPGMDGAATSGFPALKRSLSGRPLVPSVRARRPAVQPGGFRGLQQPLTLY